MRYKPTLLHPLHQFPTYKHNGQRIYLVTVHNSASTATVIPNFLIIRQVLCLLALLPFALFALLAFCPKHSNSEFLYKAWRCRCSRSMNARKCCTCYEEWCKRHHPAGGVTLLEGRLATLYSQTCESLS